MVNVGFTGTRRGLTLEQRVKLRAELLRHYAPGNRFHHGDCVGADAEAHELAKEIGYRVVVHPPVEKRLRAHCEGDLILKAQPYLDRNYSIVDCSDFLLACPSGTRELYRSGTWATVRYARRGLVPVTLIVPGTL